MKKLILGACALAMLTAASCSKDNEAASNGVPKSLSDSISAISGQSLGAYVLGDYLNYTSRSEEVTMTKKDILKGIQMAFANVDNDGVLAGLQIGLQIVNQFQMYENEGVTIDRNILLKNFRKVFEADTVDTSILANTNEVMTSLMEKVKQIKEEHDAAAREEEARATQESTDAYIAKLKAEDPEIITSASGLSYKILNPGTEPRVQDNSSIDVIYTGSLIDGTVFDQSNGQPTTFSPSGVIPGFAEGLKLLGKGGKAVLYIPGDLAYGPQGVPQAGIGPNAMLVFEVEVVDVNNPE